MNQADNKKIKKAVNEDKALVKTLKDIPIEERHNYMVFKGNDGGKFYVRREVTEAPKKADPDAGRRISGYLKWFMSPRVESIEELQARLAFFFTDCAERNDVPTVEKMALALGTNAWEVRSWTNGLGCDSQWQDVIRGALSLIGGADAENASEGRTSSSVYQQRSRAYHSLGGGQDNTLTIVNQTTESPEAISKRILASLQGLLPTTTIKDMREGEEGVFELDEEEPENRA